MAYQGCYIWLYVGGLSGWREVSRPGRCGLCGLSLGPIDGINLAAVSIGELRRAEPRGNRLHREGERRAEQNQLSGGRRLQRRRAAAAAAAALAGLS